MTDQLKAIQDDIAFLKDLVQDGSAPNRMGGSLIAAAGALYAAAAVAHWLVQTGRIAAGPWAYPAIWGGASVLYLVAGAVLKGRYGAADAGRGLASGIAWAGVGWTIFAIAASMAIVCWRANSALPTLLFPSLILGLYGLGWMVGAAISYKPWIWWTSVGSYFMALVVAWFSVTDWVMLIYAAALLLLAVLPGLALMRPSSAD